jgi:hypothetical protein
MDSKIQLEENYVRPKPNINFSSLVMIFVITYIFIISITMAFHKKSDTKFIYTGTLNINEILVLIFIIVVLTLFRIADSNFNKDTWKYITRSSSIALQPTTTEPINEKNFLRRPWNCHSSVF